MSKPETAKRVLLVIPAYNEAERIEAPMHRYVAHARSRPDIACDFLVVLNGCRDGTKAIVDCLADTYPEVGWMEYKEAIGKGGALIAGLRMAGTYEWVGFADADGATPADSLFSLLDAAGDQFDVAIARRHMEKRPFGRRVTSFGFNTIVNLLLGLKSRDTQCGAKFFRGRIVHAMLPSLTTCDMAIDVDLLLGAKDAGARRCEHFVEWEDQAGSKVRVFHTSSLMFLSVFRLFLDRRRPGRVRDWLLRRTEGLYRRIYKRPRREPPGAPDAVRFTSFLPSPES